MIQHKAICFDCDAAVDDPLQSVFAPPWCDHPDCASAVFHGVCLMRWRERRQELRVLMEKRGEAIRRHLAGECECPPRED